jgi:uncharacterized protein (TIGR00369 family)
MAALGITLVEASPERVTVEVEVNEKVHQPYGMLHGGVSALMAETAASVGAVLAAPEGYVAVGVELNASHLRAMRSGTLRAVAVPVRVGRTIQVWQIDCTNEHGHLISTARCTLSVIKNPAN